MVEKQLMVSFLEFGSIDELDELDKELALACIDAQKGSYAPYSHFNVGAAVRLDNGTVVRGANQENAAYPSGLCAERTALFAAGAQYPDNAVISLAVMGGFDGGMCDEPATPCGACRQVMAESQKRAGRAMSVILVGKNHIWKFAKVDDILPFIFTELD